MARTFNWWFPHKAGLNGSFAAPKNWMKTMVIPVVVYQEEGEEDTYSICHDSEESNYFLLVGEKVYHEFNYPFRGEYNEVLAKLKELKASEHLVLVQSNKKDDE